MWWCYSSSKGIHFTERNPWSFVEQTSVRSLAPRAEDTAWGCWSDTKRKCSLKYSDIRVNIWVAFYAAHTNAFFCLCNSVFARLMCLHVTNINVTLLCRVQWCARLWGVSFLPFPKLPALTHRPCWPTPSPWQRMNNAHKSFFTYLIKRQSEQVWESYCQTNIRKMVGDPSEPLGYVQAEKTVPLLSTLLVFISVLHQR